MATATAIPDLSVRVDYETWLSEVRTILADRHMEMDAWQEDWRFDFAGEYARGSVASDAATHASDFWWQRLLAESWT
jgi:hypothetical protein